VARYRQGDRGEPVHDIQERLSALGYPIDPDPDAVFGVGTERAVIGFQQSRSIAADGIVGPETWRTLVDAGFRLGDRILYYRLPMLHGEDVATLQRDLNALGFEAGNVDGIFGPDTLRAVIDFQQNRGMAEDGTAGPSVIAELALMVRATQKMGREVVRERVWMRTHSRTLAAQRIMLDPFCRDELEADRSWETASAGAAAARDLGAIPILSRSRDTRPSERLRARQANQIASDLVVSFGLPRSDDPAVFFFASALSRSEAGAEIAEYVAGLLGLEARGRSTPILSETRAPSIVVSTPRLGASLGRTVVGGLARWFEERDEDQPDSER
jgi:N-acetylmuramoyl-L-alanine amidase